MTRNVTVAALQTHHTWDVEDNVARVIALVEKTAEQGAQVILPSELFETPYFCKTSEQRYRDLARPAEGHPMIRRFSELAARLEVVIPMSFYERAETGLYNSAAVIDADGSVLGIYRKCHIPQFEAYHEDAFFDPSPDGPQVWNTRYVKLGLGICWDQWFPEMARAMTLMGAELLAYPSAIGSETFDPTWDSSGQWRAAMMGHSAANAIPVMASNRIGSETDDGVTLDFYGTSFICNQKVEIIADAGRDVEGMAIAMLDLDEALKDRVQWGTLQTRQPQHYRTLVDLPAGEPPV